MSVAAASDRTGAGREPRQLRQLRGHPGHLGTGGDAALVLCGYLVVLLAVPSALRIPALGLAGSPSTVYGLAALGWWAWHVAAGGRLRRDSAGSEALPPLAVRRFRFSFFVFLLCVALSYLAANLLSLPDSDVNQAEGGVLRIAGVAGVVLVAVEGLRNRRGQEVVLGFAVFLGACYASLGLLQFFTQESLIDRLDIPGLSPTAQLGVEFRSGFVRAVGTASHPLEYAVVLCMLLPLALTFSTTRTHLPLLVRWYPAAALACCAALSVSRSALVGLVLVLVLLWPTWPRAVRWGTALLGTLAASALLLVVPGMIGTIAGLFGTADSSLASRTVGFAEVQGYLVQSPWVGRGLGTFQAGYHILDNQYLLLLIEVGVLGAAALVLVVGGTAWQALRARSRATAGRDRARGAGLLVSLTAGVVLGSFFDSFSFPQSFGLFFLALGLCTAYAAGGEPRGAARGPSRGRGRSAERGLSLARGTAAAREPAPASGPAAARGRPAGRRRAAGRPGWLAALSRRWWVAVIVVAGALPLASMAGEVPGRYSVSADVIFLPPVSTVGSRNTLNSETENSIYLAAIVERSLYAASSTQLPRPVFGEFYGAGMRSGYWVHLPNRGGQWHRDFKEPRLRIDVVGGSAQEVLERLQEQKLRVEAESARWQSQLGVQPQSWVTTRLSPEQPQAAYHPIRGRRAQLVAAGLAVVLACWAAWGVDAAWRRRSARGLVALPDRNAAAR